MKNLIGLAVFILIVAGCSLLNKKAETNATDATPANIATKPETIDKTSTGALTLEKFNQLQNDMKYEEVVRILGGEGTETSSYSSGSMKSVTYKWDGEKYAKIFATFRDDKLSSKSQSNLK